MRQSWWMGAVFLAWAMPATATADDAPRPKEVAALVRQLGADGFAQREQAQRRLIELGEAVRPALARASETPDPEVRWRARSILATLEKIAYEAEINAYIIKGEVGKLPCVRRYSRMVGTDEAARALFGEMYRAERSLLTLAATRPREASAAVGARCTELRRTPNARVAGVAPALVVGSIAAVLFLDADPRLEVDAQTGTHLYCLTFRTEFQQAIADAQRSGPLQKLLGAWINEESDAAMTQRKYLVALRNDVRESLVSVVRRLGDRKPDGPINVNELLIVGRFGGREHVPLLEKLLEDETVCGNYRIGGKTYVTQTRDVALAVLVHLAGQDHAEFGFARIRKNPKTLFTTHTLGFSKEEQAVREQAIARWRSRRVEQATKPR